MVSFVAEVIDVRDNSHAPLDLVFHIYKQTNDEVRYKFGLPYTNWNQVIELKGKELDSFLSSYSLSNKSTNISVLFYKTPLDPF